MNRHLFRSIALQTLFEWDFRETAGQPLKDVKAELARNAAEFAPGAAGRPFMEELTLGVLGKRETLDKIISQAAPDWPMPKISLVDRNVLRLGLYELLFADRRLVPPKVAINEAIELAKTFGGERSGKFVNGVLGTVYKEIGEPGKDETSNSGMDKVKSEKLPKLQLVGAVVYTSQNREIFLALVHDVFGYWTLTKGRVRESEDLKTAVKRVAKEELGIVVEPERELGVNEYVANQPKDGRVKKQVSYFLARANFQDLKLGSSGGLDDARWFKLKDILDLKLYDDIVPIVTKAVKLLVTEK